MVALVLAVSGISILLPTVAEEEMVNTYNGMLLSHKKQTNKQTNKQCHL